MYPCRCVAVRLIGDFHECREAATADGTLRLEGEVGWGAWPDLAGARRLS